MNHPPCLEVKDLTQSFGAFALRGISLRVSRGEYVAVVGPCGAGKTLLIETIAGFHEHPPQTIWLEGQDVAGLSPERRSLGYLCQGDALFPHLSVMANIRFGLRYLGPAAAEQAGTRIAGLLALFGIERLVNRRDPQTLSGGEARLVALARALVPGPRLLLMDEPLHSLDVGVARRVLETLHRIPQETGVPVVHITHDISEVANLASRLVVLDQGQVVQSGRLADLRRVPATRFVADLAGAVNLLQLPADARELHVAGRRIGLDRLPRGSEPILAVLDPDALELQPALDGGAARVIGIHETPDAIEFTIAAAEHRLLVRARGQPLADEILRLGAAVHLDIPDAAVHLVRETRP